MTDGGFHLTALDARRYDFGNALRGYDRGRVDQFREEVADELERLARAHQEYETELRLAREQLRSFRDRDKAINEALVSAQQLRAEIREQAEREAQVLLREAQADGDRQLAVVREELRRAEQELQALWRTRRAYLAQLRHQIERQLTEINSAEAEPVPAIVTLRNTPPLPDVATVAREVRELPPRTAMPTPSWLDTLLEDKP
jgi:cell division septum initiation protein DivIVA